MTQRLLQVQIPYWDIGIVFGELELIHYVIQGLTLLTASLVLSLDKLLPGSFKNNVSSFLT